MRIDANTLKRLIGYFGCGFVIICMVGLMESNAYNCGVEDGMTFIGKLIQKFGLDIPDDEETREQVRQLWKEHTSLFQK